MSNATFIQTTQDKISTGKIKQGQVIFTSDSKKLYWDYNDNMRIEITDIIELNNETDRISVSNPANKFYFVVSSSTLWRFQFNKWIQLSMPNEIDVNIITGLSTIAKTGEYNDLKNKPYIPNKTSDLENDKNYILASSFDGDDVTLDFFIAGKSAYEIAVEKGFIGTEEEWLESLKGKDGSSDIVFATDEDIDNLFN